MFKLFVAIILIANLTSFNRPKLDECEIAAIYKSVSPNNGTKVITSGDELEEIDLILLPMTIDEGKYSAEVTRKARNLYKIDGKNIYIETKYCYEYTYGEKVILNIENGYYSKGKIIFNL